MWGRQSVPFFLFPFPFTDGNAQQLENGTDRRCVLYLQVSRTLAEGSTNTLFLRASRLESDSYFVIHHFFLLLNSIHCLATLRLRLLLTPLISEALAFVQRHCFRFAPFGPSFAHHPLPQAFQLCPQCRISSVHSLSGHRCPFDLSAWLFSCSCARTYL